MTPKTAFILLLASLLVACESEDKAPVKSADIQTEIVAKANGSGETVIEATIQVKGNKLDKNIDIELPFSIEAKVGDQTRTLFKTERGGEIVYTTKLPTDSEKDKFIVSANGNGPSQDNVIVLPQPFNITSSPKEYYDRHEDINITWNNVKTGGLIEAGFALSCNNSTDPSLVILKRKISDNGSLKINAAELVEGPDVDVDTSRGCNAMVILSRVRQENLDPKFGNGSYSLGVQERITNFSIKGSATL